LKQKALKKAKDFYISAIKADPYLLPPYMSLGKIFRGSNQLEEAAFWYQEVVDRYPGYLPAHLFLAWIYDTQKKPENAEAHYRSALGIEPEHANAANNLAFLLAEKGEALEEAFSLARIARIKSPDDPDVLDTMGWIYYKKGSYENAISEFEESLSLAPDNPVVCYHLGLALYRINEFEKAKQYLRRALKLNPEFNGAVMARSLIK